MKTAAPPGALDTLRAFLGWLLPRHAALGGVTEIRILGGSGRGGVWSAWIGPDDVEGLITALTPVGPSPRVSIPRGDYPRIGEANIYFSLQAVQPDAAPERGLPIRRVSQTSRDTDIRAYSIFVVDVDPVRKPAGRSSTDAEKAEALAVTERVSAWLRELGVHPALADSGNGYHLLVPLVPGLEDEVATYARQGQALLRLLDERFSTDGAKVDRSTFNPSRILKLYGTTAVKGPNTADTPHRVSCVSVEDLPDDIDLFARLAEAPLEMVPTPAPAPAPPRPKPMPAAPRPSPEPSPAWNVWRTTALARLPLEAVYGDLLTGKASGATWLQCRDPWSATGDQTPSAGVADGNGDADRGTFHSFIRSESMSVFDFMVKRGVVSDFRAACARVAEIAGVPLPVGSVIADVLAQFRVAWAKAGTDDERNRALQAALRALAPAPAVQREAAIEAVRDAAGLNPRTMRAALAEVRHANKAERRERALAAPSGRPGVAVVDFVENRDTVEGFFEALVLALLPSNRFFRMERELVFVRRGYGPSVVDERNLPGRLSALVEVRFLQETEDGVVFNRYDVLPSDLARAFVHSPRVAARLPVLLGYTRTPVFDRNWRFVGRPGFHPESGLFYDGPPIEPATGIERVMAALQGFAWKDGPDLVNFLGALLTMLTMPCWGRGHPFLAINGNRAGVGKSTLARVLGVLAEGVEPTTVSFTANDEEFEKQIATRIEAGDRVVVIDNAKVSGSVTSAVLERCITDTRLNFRRLGSNTSIGRAQNDVLFVLTMNLAQLGPDLRRRALPVNLELHGDPRDAEHPSDDPVGDATDGRLLVVAELVGMVQRWLTEGKPVPDVPARHSTNQKWARTMDGVLSLAGFTGFLSNFAESEHAFDPDYTLVGEVAALHHAEPQKHAGEWAKVLVGGVLEERLTDGRGNGKPARAQATIVGQLFAAYVGEVFEADGGKVTLRGDRPRKGHAPVYWFEAIGA